MVKPGTTLTADALSTLTPKPSSLILLHRSLRLLYSCSNTLPDSSSKEVDPCNYLGYHLHLEIKGLYAVLRAVDYGIQQNVGESAYFVCPRRVSYLLFVAAGMNNSASKAWTIIAFGIERRPTPDSAVVRRRTCWLRSNKEHEPNHTRPSQRRRNPLCQGSGKLLKGVIQLLLRLLA